MNLDLFNIRTDMFTPRFFEHILSCICIIYNPHNKPAFRNY